jgi:hypothetical protein
LAIALSPLAASAVVLNEIFVSHVGTDTGEFIELCGAPGEDLTDLWLVIIEGEGTGAGLCDDAIDIDASFAALPADGKLVIGNASVANVDIIVPGASDLYENGTETILLVSTTTPIIQGTTDVDTNNDGIEEISLGTIVDGVGLVDTGFPATDFIYYDQPTLIDGTLFPAGVQRCEDCTGPLTRLMCFNMTGCAEPYSDISPGVANNCPGPAPEACCFFDGACVDLVPDDCIAQGGTPQGEGSSCASTFCPVPPQACCFADGSCQDMLEADCINAFGTPQGAGTSCATVACPQPTEACCYIDGFCADLVPSECTSTGGIPQGPGTSCSSTFCPPPPPVGACCFADGSCIDGIYESDCSAAGGTFNTGLLCQEVQCTNATEPKSWGKIKGQYR